MMVSEPESRIPGESVPGGGNPPDPGSSGAEIAEAVNTAKLATLGMLVAGVAHEVNTPLGALSSNHDVLKRALQRLQDILADDVVDETELEEVRRIVRALDGIMRVNDVAMERVDSLVGSLRSFGRPDRADVGRVDLHEGIETALTLLRHKLEGSIEVVRDFGELPVIQCYPQQLHQVFLNLVLNAIQAVAGREGGPGGAKGAGTVTVRTRADGECVVVEVEDTGPGIRPELLDRIFEPGFTTKGSRVGMGLGLLIARQVVDRHGGTIEAANLEGGGARFRVRLPVSLEDVPEPGGTPQSPSL